MAIGHCRVTTITRAMGHTAAAALAYRFGIAVRCPRTGEHPNFAARARRGEIAGTGIEAARPTSIAENAQTFTAAIEAAERRRDSRLARDVQVALPHELDEPARLELARTFAAGLAERYGTVAAWAVHRPHEGDARNHHVHVMMATRELDESGQLAGKLRRLDNPRTAGDEVAAIRNTWADLADQALERAGLETRVHVGQRLDAAPAPSIPAGVIGRERRHARDRATRRRLRDRVDASPPTVDLDPDEIDLWTAEEQRSAAANLRTVDAGSLIRRERSHLVTVAAAAVAGATVEHTGPPQYERRARSRRARARDQAPDRRRRPRRREREEPSEASTTAPAALDPAPTTAPEPIHPPRRRRRRERRPQEPVTAPEARETTTTPELERPPRHRRRRTRPGPASEHPTSRPAPAPIVPRPGDPDLVELDRLIVDAHDRQRTLAELEALANDIAEDLTDDRTRQRVRTHGRAVGMRRLIVHAGYPADAVDAHGVPVDASAIDPDDEIARALEPEVAPYHVAPLMSEFAADPRVRQGHGAHVDAAIRHWCEHWARATDRIVDAVLGRLARVPGARPPEPKPPIVEVDAPLVQPHVRSTPPEWGSGIPFRRQTQQPTTTRATTPAPATTRNDGEEW